MSNFLNREKIDIVHCRSRLPTWLTLVALRGVRGHKPRLVTSVHGLHSVSTYSSVIGRGELIEVVSNTARDYLLRNYPTVDEARVRLIYRGIDPSAYYNTFRPPERWTQAWNRRMHEFNPDSEPLLTLAGRLSPLKGHQEFLSVLELLNSTGFACRGLVVGGGDSRHRRYLSKLRQRVAESTHLKDRVWFTGQRSDVREIFSVSACVLSMSRKPESFGRTVLEALSLGIPVVAFDHGGVGEILRSIFPSGAVKLGDVNAVANKIVELCNSSNSIGNHAMTLENMCSKTIEMYEELAQ